LNVGCVGSDRGFAEFYGREFAAVYRPVFALCRNPSVAEEATQEAFARALERWRRLRDRPWAAGWVTTTAMNVARRSLRRRPFVETPEAVREEPEGGWDLWRAVGALPARQQEAVVLFYVMDLPVTEVAQVMRCEQGTVKAHLAKARASLRGALEGVRDDR
jgi:RNA polymerase sigma-70 factor (ECF subfamily)